MSRQQTVSETGVSVAAAAAYHNPQQIAQTRAFAQGWRALGLWTTNPWRGVDEALALAWWNGHTTRVLGLWPPTTPLCLGCRQAVRVDEARVVYQLFLPGIERHAGTSATFHPDCEPVNAEEYVR